MNYADSRPLIESGDVIAFSHDKWDSINDLEIQAVRFFTQSEFAHVGVAWVIGGRVFIIEAVVPKVRIFPLSKLTPFYWVPMRKPMTPEAEEAALSIVGEDYSKIEAIRGYFGTNCEENHLWECAEEVKFILKKNGIALPGKATPTQVVHDVMAIGNPLILIQ